MFWIDLTLLKIVIDAISVKKYKKEGGKCMGVDLAIEMHVSYAWTIICNSILIKDV
jgi:hypothetical protein